MVNSEINVLDEHTIDKIAAGEVIERPSSVIKELIENSIDAMANTISIEIKDGGTSFIRVSDNGIGIRKDQVRKAFLRHSTSKIKSAIDLYVVKTLGFRGEALSSIAAVSRVNLITKHEDDVLGTSYVIEGGVEKDFSDIGAPKGTTFIIKDLFFNTPVRKKFLNSNQTEAIHIEEIIAHLALSRPDIAFRFINQGKEKIVTSGNNNLMEVIYRIYGKNIADNILPIKYESENIKIEGFIGKSVINRGNRKFEIFFINKRSVSGKKLSSALEDGYKGYLMQHQHPFCILNLYFTPGVVDVNFHPKKEEVRIEETKGDIYAEIAKSVHIRLIQREDIDVINDFKIKNFDNNGEPNNEDYKNNNIDVKNKVIGNEPFFERKREIYYTEDVPYIKEEEYEDVSSLVSPDLSKNDLDFTPSDKNILNDTKYFSDSNFPTKEEIASNDKIEIASNNSYENKRYEQRSFLTEYAKEHFDIIGQVFNTYWIIEYNKKMYIVDQHAAHEKVNFEKLMKQFKDKSILTQTISPPIMVTLDAEEKIILDNNMESFSSFGFSIEHFGGMDFALTGVPFGLLKADKRELFYDILGNYKRCKNIIDSKVSRQIIATMACKASIKGNEIHNSEEIKSLISNLLTLENPYHCPHGRPTMISFSRDDLDKMFKRIV